MQTGVAADWRNRGSVQGMVGDHVRWRRRFFGTRPNDARGRKNTVEFPLDVPKEHEVPELQEGHYLESDGPIRDWERPSKTPDQCRDSASNGWRDEDQGEPPGRDPDGEGCEPCARRQEMGAQDGRVGGASQEASPVSVEVRFWIRHGKGRELVNIPRRCHDAPRCVRRQGASAFVTRSSMSPSFIMRETDAVT